MEVLVTGVGGLLGSNVAVDAAHRGGSVTGTYHTNEPELDIDLERLDIREHERFEQLVSSVDPDVVVNCAALTDVDGCESHPEDARAINAVAPGEMARMCQDHDVGFVQVSTDYVFDGTASQPYNESADANPVQIYGESKRRGEELVQEHHDAPLLLRLSFVYGLQRPTGELTGFPRWVRDQLRGGESIPLFTDQRVTPSRAGQVSETILYLVASGESGLFHVASRSCVSPFEIGKAIAERLGVSRAMVEESTLADVDRPARRPAYTCLDVASVEEVLGRPQPTIEQDLTAIEAAFET